MKKKFITIIIAFITVFFSQSQVWASSENIKIQTEFNNLQIDKSVFLAVDNSPGALKFYRIFLIIPKVVPCLVFRAI